MAEKASPSGKNKLKLGVSWAQVVNDRVPAISTNATGVQVSSTACDSAKTKNPLYMNLKRCQLKKQNTH